MNGSMPACPLCKGLATIGPGSTTGWMFFECPRCTGVGTRAEIDASGMTRAGTLTMAEIARLVVRSRGQHVRYTAQLLDGLLAAFPEESAERKAERLWDNIGVRMRRQVYTGDPELQGIVGAATSAEIDSLLTSLIPNWIERLTPIPGGGYSIKFGPMAQFGFGDATYDGPEE